MAGQVLLRLDPDLHEAETRALRTELGLRCCSSGASTRSSPTRRSATTRRS
jgi:hypothetical protein